MDMNFDREERSAAPFALTAGVYAPERLDWHGLRARLAAGYAVHSALTPSNPRETLIAEGSFDRGSAQAMAVYGLGSNVGQAVVNPSALANGNSGCGNDAAVAGPTPAGDRG